MYIKDSKDRLSLPSNVLSLAGTNSEFIHILAWIATDSNLANNTAALSALVNCSESVVRDAISFWIDKGILISSSSNNSEEDSLTFLDYCEKKLQRQLSIKELKEFREAYRLFGNLTAAKTFLDHCLTMGYSSSVGILSYAKNFCNRGENTISQIQAKAQEVEEVSEFEKSIRSLFQVQSRTLSSKEKSFIREWMAFGFDYDIIVYAYDLTIKHIGRPYIPYAHAILKNWYDAGIRTAIEAKKSTEDIRSIDRSSSRSNNPPLDNSSFDTDDFFNAALVRTFSELGGHELSEDEKEFLFAIGKNDSKKKSR